MARGRSTKSSRRSSGFGPAGCQYRTISLSIHSVGVEADDLRIRCTLDDTRRFRVRYVLGAIRLWVGVPLAAGTKLADYFSRFTLSCTALVESGTQAFLTQAFSERKNLEGFPDMYQNTCPDSKDS